MTVTTLAEAPLEPGERPPDGQTFVLGPRFDRPLHPLSTSTWLPIHARTVGSVMRRFGLPIDGLDERVLLGRVYGRMVPMLDRGRDGSPPPAWVMRLLFELLPPMRRRLARARAYDGEPAIASVLDRWEREGRGSAAERTRALRSVDRAAMSDEALADHLDEVVAHVERVADSHFELTFAGVLIPTGRLGLLVEELLGWEPFDVITLVAGYGGASTDHGRAVERLRSQLGPDVVRAALADPTMLADEPATEAYLRDHGHRVNVDLARPTEAEDLGLVADHLRRYAAATKAPVDPRVAAHEAERRAMAELRDPADRARFASTLALARRGRPFGDETEASVLETLTIMRFVAIEAAHRFVSDGRSGSEEDVWFLQLDELRACLRSATTELPRLDRRRREFAWAMANPAPLHLGPDPAPPPPVEAVPGRYRSTVGAVLWSAAAASPVTYAPDQEVLQGEAASPGRATGTIRVVRDMAEFDRVQAGDIVVCPTTAAAWSPIFGVIAGLITEHGGLLSHPAILAREYDLPAVLGVPDATRRLADGAHVEIDGSRGTVSLG